MKLDELYNKEKFSKISKEARDVSKAYLDGNRFLDTAKEWVYINTGMIECADKIHREAHLLLQKLDIFGDTLHEIHCIQEYPETPELDYASELTDMDSVFELVIRVLDNVAETLEAFRAVTDNAEFRALSIKAEDFITENSAEYTKFLEMWQMWDKGNSSLTSFDDWCR